MSQLSFRLWIGLLRRCRPAAVTSCSGLPATFTVRPSISRNRPGTSSAITSMTCSLSASAAERLRLDSTDVRGWQCYRGQVGR